MPIKKSNIFQDASVTFISRIIILLFTIGTQSLLAWLLGPADRGSLAVCQVYAFVFFLLFTVGINASGIYYISSNKISLSDGVINILTVCILCSSLAILCGVQTMQFDLSFFEKADRNSFFLGLLSIPTLMIQVSLINVLTAVREFKWYSILSSIDQMWQFLFTLILVGFLKFGINGALAAYIIEGILTSLIILVFLRIKYRIILTPPSFDIMKSLFLYGIRYHVGKISNFANLQMGTIFVAFFATKVDVGYFAIATQTISKINVIPDTLITVLLPRVSSSQEGMSILVAKTARLTFIICSLLLLIIVIAAKPIVAVLFSPSFYDAVPIIQILALGFLFRSATKIYEPYLLGTNRPGSVSYSSFISIIINFILILVLMPHLGVIGAAIGTSLAYFAGGLILLFSFKKYSGAGLFQIITIQRADIDFLIAFVKKLTGKMSLPAS